MKCHPERSNSRTLRVAESKDLLLPLSLQLHLPYLTRAAFSSRSRIAAPIPPISGTGHTITAAPASSSSRHPPHPPPHPAPVTPQTTAAPTPHHPPMAPTDKPPPLQKHPTHPAASP